MAYVPDDELVALLKAVRRYSSQTAAARGLGMNRNTLVSRLSEAKRRGLTAESSPLAAKDAEIKNLKQQIKAAQEDALEAERIREVIYKISGSTPRPPEWLAKQDSVKSERFNQRDIPMTIWSDWHWGEVVRKEEVGGVNEYSTVIARQRLERLVSSTIDLVQCHMPCKNAPGIVVMLGGDMISGDIHEELADTNDSYTLAALLDLQDNIAKALKELLENFKRVFVAGVVGNHGRSTKKPRMKGRVHTSFEWNLYCQLERYFAGNKRITFMVPGETDAYFSVAGHRFLLTHGDSLGVRGGDGIIGALGPIMRGAIKTGRSEAQIGRDFDTIVMGHWHQYLSLPGVIVNNCLKGYDEFARLALRAPARPASQALWGVHPKWGITSRWEVFVQDPIHPPVNEHKWVAIKES